MEGEKVFVRITKLHRALTLCTHAHKDLWSKSEQLYPSQNQAPTPGTHLPLPGAHLHAIYINACPHAKLLAKEPQPGHTVKEAVVELGRKSFGTYVWKTQERCGPAPYPYKSPEALLLGNQGNRWRKHSTSWTQGSEGKSLGMGVTAQLGNLGQVTSKS